jgi:hypothetical protein
LAVFAGVAAGMNAGGEKAQSLRQGRARFRRAQNQVKRLKITRGGQLMPVPRHSP